VPYDLPVARIIAGFGLALTVAWILISDWHLPYINHLRSRAIKHLTEYQDTRESWQTTRRGLQRKLPINELIAYGVPALAAVLWAALLLVAWLR
jgi:hypothetical protein